MVLTRFFLAQVANSLSNEVPSILTGEPAIAQLAHNHVIGANAETPGTNSIDRRESNPQQR